MQPSARDSYLVTQVTTATPQKLHLMLIDAAIRHTRRTIELWAVEQEEEAGESLIRAQQIVTELLSSLNPDADRALTRRMAAVYMFVFRSLVNSHVQHDVQAAEDALRVLNEERETWRLVCLQIPDDAPDAVGRPETVEAPRSVAVPPAESRGDVQAATASAPPASATPSPATAPIPPASAPAFRSGWPGTSTGYGPGWGATASPGFSLDG